MKKFVLKLSKNAFTSPIANAKILLIKCVQTINNSLIIFERVLNKM